MPNKPILLYWDSCVFISAIQKSDGRYPILEAIIEQAKAENAVIVTSAFTIAEVVKESGDAESKQSAMDAAKIRDFFENDYLAIRNVDRHIGEMAAEFVRLHNVKPPDAIHLATALNSKCACLHTYDKKLFRLDGKIGWPALSIKPPSHPDGHSGPMLF